jgi:DnaJ-related protein SCJ1
MKFQNFLLVLFFSVVLCDEDLYKIFEVDRSASQEVIKKKYRELTRKYHPDKNRDNPEASAKYVEVNKAYEILSDPKLRRKYDRGGMDAVNRGEQEGQGFDPFDIFGNMFGGGGRRENRDMDLKVKLRVTLKDLYLGRDHEVYKVFTLVCVYEEYDMPAL